VRIQQHAWPAGAFVLLFSFAATPAAHAQNASPAAAETPNWKDQQEYDLFSKMSQTADPKARLELLNTWQDKYPQTAVAALRLKYYVAALAVLAQTTPGERQLLLDKCQESLKVDPKDVNALYQVSLWGPVVGGASPSSDLLSQVDGAAKGFISGADAAFAPANKPAGVSDADFVRAKSFRLGVAHDALAWEAVVKRDMPTAENEYKASLTVNPDQGAVAAQYAKLLYDEKKFPEALFEYGRAAQYTGPGPALPPVTRSQLTDFFTKTYKDFHGGSDGVDQVLAQAKMSALPPANFAIASAADAANKEADALNARIASDPGFGLWYTIRQNLTGDQGDTFFKTVKNALIPGGAQGVRNFSGTVISLDSPDRPTKVMLGVDDPAKLDATLEFSKPLPASALDAIRAGKKLEFAGVADSYTKDPYMLTLKDPTLTGVPTELPDRKAAHKHN
jgi:hypothetical protein